jgi:hypothetical protein
MRRIRTINGYTLTIIMVDLLGMGPAAGRAPPYPEQAELKGQPVPVVDDNSTNRKVLRGQLLRCATAAIDAAAQLEAAAAGAETDRLAELTQRLRREFVCATEFLRSKVTPAEQRAVGDRAQ